MSDLTETIRQAVRENLPAGPRFWHIADEVTAAVMKVTATALASKDAEIAHLREELLALTNKHRTSLTAANERVKELEGVLQKARNMIVAWSLKAIGAEAATRNVAFIDAALKARESSHE